MKRNQYFTNLGYRVSSPYGPRILGGKPEFHPGVDLVVEMNGPIKAFTSGEVVYAGEGLPNTGYNRYGNLVAIKDKNGAVHVYGHLSKVNVSKGAKVVKDQQIGNQGSTGLSTGQHLHYEVRKKEAYVENREDRCFVPDLYLEQFYTETKKGASFSEVAAAKEQFTQQKTIVSKNKYIVKEGDTLSEIAKANHLALEQILKLNPQIKDPSKISIGSSIKTK